MSIASILVVIPIAIIAYLIVGKWRRREAARDAPSAPVIPTQVTAPAARGKRYLIDRYPTPSPAPSDTELGLVRVSDSVIHIKPCPHAHLPRAVAFEVYGLIIKTGEIPRCPACSQALLEALFERCAECGKGIAINSFVCISWIGAERPYTHTECAEDQSLICGRWGQGRLIPLDQLELEIDVSPGTVTLMQLNDLAMQAAIERSEQPADDTDDGDTGSKPDAN